MMWQSLMGSCFRRVCWEDSSKNGDLQTETSKIKKRICQWRPGSCSCECPKVGRTLQSMKTEGWLCGWNSICEGILVTGTREPIKGQITQGPVGQSKHLDLFHMQWKVTQGFSIEGDEIWFEHLKVHSGL